MQHGTAWSSVPGLLRIFLPDVADEWRRGEEQPAQLVHYTEIERALNILQSRQLWLRNARRMSDETEIKHGIDLFERSWGGPEGRNLKRELLAIDTGGESAVERVLSTDRVRIEENTYIACAAIHETASVDGALPHWDRGDVGLAFNRLSLLREADNYGAGAALVQYRRKNGYQDQFRIWTEVLQRNATQLSRLKPGAVGEAIAQAAMYRAMLIKHPRFESEREWRMFICHDDTPEQDAELLNESATDGLPREEGFGWGMQDVGGNREFVYALPMNWGRNLLEGIFVKPSERSDAYIERLDEELRRMEILDIVATHA